MSWDETEFLARLKPMSDAQISLSLAKREGDFSLENRRDVAEWLLRERLAEREALRTSSANFWAKIAAATATVAAIAALIDALR